MKIERLLLWFNDGNEMCSDLNQRYFPLGILLCRSINMFYNGKRIKFANIRFLNEKAFELNSQWIKNTSYAFNGHMQFFGLFDYQGFGTMMNAQQDLLVWNTACHYLTLAAVELKNKSLETACDKARKWGLGIKLNTDFTILGRDVYLYGRLFKTGIKFHFEADNVYSYLFLKIGEDILFEEKLGESTTGNEFFLSMYKDIKVESGVLVVIGEKGSVGLPRVIEIQGDIIKFN